MSIRLMIGAAFAVFATRPVTRTAQPGDPLPGITPVEFEEFRLGLDDFLEVETSEEGLGPAFNGTSCAVCHNVPAIGGASIDRRDARRRPRRRAAHSRRSTPTGETLFHLFSVPAHGCQPIMPAEANVIARRMPIPLFGAGLVEAIPDDTILALEDPDDRNGDGISGRAAIVIDVATGERRVGRFGWKAQHATLLAFSADAYRNEMGITNDLFPRRVGVRRRPPSRCALRSDPRSRRHRAIRGRGRRGIDNFAGFMQFLAPVARGAVDDGRARRRAGVRRDRLRHLPRAGADDGREREPAVRPQAGAALLRSAAARRRHRRRHPAGVRGGRRDPHAGAVGSALPPAAAARRLGGDHRGRHARHAGEADLARRGFEQLSDVDKAALMAFLKSL